MTSRVQNARSSVSLNRPPNTRPVGEFFVNFADNQLGVIDPTPTARDLLPIRFHSPTAAYAINDLVRQTTGLYQAKAAIPAHAFNASEWNQFLTAPQGDARWLPLTGGVLTGLLTLSGAPTANLHAATKLYVDTQDALRLPLTGGVLTGPLTVGGAGISYAQGAAHFYAFNWTGTQLQAWVDNTNVGSFAIGSFLPLAGGTVSGNITANAHIVGPTGGYLTGDATYAYYVQDSGGWAWRYARANGTMQYVRGGDSAVLFTIDGSGNGSVAQSWTVGLDVNAQRNVVAAGTVQGGYVNSTGNVNANSSVTASVDISAARNISAGAALFAHGSNIVIGPGGSGRVMQMAGGYYWDFNTTTGDAIWVMNNQQCWVMSPLDGRCYNNLAWVGGHGAYRDVSDERLKTDITPATVGLPEILAIEPINFHRLGPEGEVYPADEIGFSAQNVQPIIPEAVTEAGIGLPDALAVASEMILAAVVNAIKTLDQRITVLEAT